MKHIELLAPAKNLQNGIIAIKAGADAVYIGASKFGARAKVGNNLDDIKELVDFAHLFNAKVYVTVNTILDDNELIEAKQLINKLYENNVDAIIIQDMGILELSLPPIPLYASTQMHNSSLDKINFLQSKGFDRVILPREFSLSEIKNISDNTSIHLEAFCHGALCVSYSGQCYLSYKNGGRSANRGECAQPCRKKYSLVDSTGKYIVKDKYLLSLKDLNLSMHLEKMINAGVSSFKIEGRLKDANYIKNVVSFYREQMDIAINKTNSVKSSSGILFRDFEPDVNKTFNRSYTTYFLNNKIKNVASLNSPKNIGETIGKITKIVEKKLYVNHNLTINNGDGITVYNKGELIGTNVNNSGVDFIEPNNISIFKLGDVVYRNYDKSFNDILEKSNIERKLAVFLTVTSDEKYIDFKIEDELGYSAKLSVNNDFEDAREQDKAKFIIQKQLSKLGDTVFQLEKININLKKMPFIPVGQLNSIRRNLIDDLIESKLQNYQNVEALIKEETFNYPAETVDYRANIYNQKARDFYQKHKVNVSQMAVETGISLNDREVMISKYCILCQLNICKKNKAGSEFVEPYFLVDETNYRYKLNFNCKECKMSVINSR